MIDAQALLLDCDQQLRADAETAVIGLGRLRLATFEGGQGFVTYQNLAGLDARTMPRLVSAALDHFCQDPSVTRVEWKTRGHDRAPDLHSSLMERGFTSDEPESIMIGRAHPVELRAASR